MIYRLADNIISPLGETTAENYQAVKAGHSALQQHCQKWGTEGTSTISLFSDEQIKNYTIKGMSRFEGLVFHSVNKAIKETVIDVSSPKTVFILSTTKANVEGLSENLEDDNIFYPSTAGKHIAEKLGITTEPIIVCNACISGVSAIILAQRLLDAHLYDTAIICGAEIQTKFTLSGFQSLKAVSENECKPFDLERIGMNLGEAVATLIVSNNSQKNKETWCIEQGAIRNDAFHISSPSKNGEGARLALEAVLHNISADDLALINAHGTATMFNDQMESVAIERAGLSTIPVNALKGYFGHTLGAAGILETIMTMAAIDDNTILSTRGFHEYGVSGKILLFSENTTTSKKCFVKMISGFGGGNGAILVKKETGKEPHQEGEEHGVPFIKKTHTIRLTPSSLTIDGKDFNLPKTDKPLLTALYKQHVGDYPKFYKMDGLSRLGFIASELLLKQEKRKRFTPCKDRAIVLINHSSSVCADKKFIQSISDIHNYFPSPSVFIYTLPNIVTGEIAMRNQYHGETSFYIIHERNDDFIWQLTCTAFADQTTKSIISGWIDYQDDNHFEADIYIAELKEKQ